MQIIRERATTGPNRSAPLLLGCTSGPDRTRRWHRHVSHRCRLGFGSCGSLGSSLCRVARATLRGLLVWLRLLPISRHLGSVTALGGSRATRTTRRCAEAPKSLSQKPLRQAHAPCRDL